MKAHSRHRSLLGMLALTFLAALPTEVSVRRLAQAEAIEAIPVSIARVRLELRAGRYFRHGASVPFTGWVTDHFPDGAVKVRSAMRNGRLEGVSEGWFATGELELREEFRNGRAQGTRTTWHANGQMRSQGQLVAGQYQGLYRQWHENGARAAEAEFDAGHPHGLSRAWYATGCLQAEALMNHGEVAIRQLYPDGQRREPTLFAGTKSP